ncbi:MAG: chromate transporter [Paenibacillaceae bacterium]
MKRSRNQTWLELWELFWSFCKISPVTFGGGYAMLPVIEHEVMTLRGWVKEEEMAEVISISGAAPGGIGVNAAAFIGYKVLGWRGLVAAVTGMMLPTFLIVLSLGIFFANMRDQPKVMAGLQGIQMAVIALIAYAGVKMARSAIYDKTTTLVFIIALLGLIFIGIHPILLIPLGAFAGIVLVKCKESLGLVVYLKKHQANPKEQKFSTMQPKFPDYYFGDGI